MKEIMFWLFKDPVNSGLDQFDHAQSVKNGLKVKKIKLPQMNFFLEKQLINKPLLLLSSTYWPFSLCKTLKKFLQRIESYGDASFLGPK